MRRFLLAFCLFATPVLADCGVGTVAQVVTTTGTQVLAAHDVYVGRARWMLQNTGTDDAYCAVGSPNGNSSLVAPNGILLVANGGNWQETAPLAYGIIRYLPDSAIWCVAKTTSTTIVACDY